MRNQQMEHGLSAIQRLPQGAAATPEKVPGPGLPREPAGLSPGGLRLRRTLPKRLKRFEQARHQGMGQRHRGQERPTHQEGHAGRVAGEKMARIGVLHTINTGRRRAACAGNQSRHIEQNAQVPAFGFAGIIALKACARPGGEASIL
jgi:hypothetical protein